MFTAMSTTLYLGSECLISRISSVDILDFLPITCKVHRGETPISEHVARLRSIVIRMRLYRQYASVQTLCVYSDYFRGQLDSYSPCVERHIKCTSDDNPLAGEQLTGLFMIIICYLSKLAVIVTCLTVFVLPSNK